MKRLLLLLKAVAFDCWANTHSSFKLYAIQLQFCSQTLTAYANNLNRHTHTHTQDMCTICVLKSKKILEKGGTLLGLSLHNEYKGIEIPSSALTRTHVHTHTHIGHMTWLLTYLLNGQASHTIRRKKCEQSWQDTHFRLSVLIAHIDRMPKRWTLNTNQLHKYAHKYAWVYIGLSVKSTVSGQCCQLTS